MLGYDWTRLHAALNDLPAALLLMAVPFDLLGAINRRDSLTAVRRVLGKQEQMVFTTAGVIGVGLLVFTGKLGGSLVFEHGVGVRQEHVTTEEHDHR